VDVVVVEGGGKRGRGKVGLIKLEVKRRGEKQRMKQRRADMVTRSGYKKVLCC